MFTAVPVAVVLVAVRIVTDELLATDATISGAWPPAPNVMSWPWRSEPAERPVVCGLKLSVSTVVDVWVLPVPVTTAGLR